MFFFLLFPLIRESVSQPDFTQPWEPGPFSFGVSNLLIYKAKTVHYNEAKAAKLSKPLYNLTNSCFVFEEI